MAAPARVSSEPIPEIDERHACFPLKVVRSPIHRWGVVALADIPANRKVIEYTGERISRKETKRRADSTELHYLFTLDDYWTIDGTVGGSGAEYINHSCDPNIRAVVMRGHILYYSLRAIKKGEELLIDYHFDANVEKVECKCGAIVCRGTINLKKDRKK
ncbi:MAG TPA: SET domain-containing protein-lysine N-methyltransferase [Bryobacteraceae bacterium]|nr:SET domain-containing protein-lysine N-methyltransferase [Bryobacteraceae bacterium]